MADKKQNSGKGNTNQNNGFTPTFRKVADMTADQKECFIQGCKTSENKVKERLKFTKPKDKK